MAYRIFLNGLTGLLALFITLSPVFGQPVQLKWFPLVKTEKDQRTLQLLDAGKQGFYLLRWQDSRTDATGKRSPAVPLLTQLTPGGERLHDAPLPGFENGGLDFRFAIASDSVLLVVYEARNSAGSQTLFARRLNLYNRKWSAAPQVLFTELTTEAPAFPNVWFSRSFDNRYTCIYRMSSGKEHRMAMAMLDQDFQVQWQRNTELPGINSRMNLHQVCCTGKGAVLFHCQAFDPASKVTGRPFESVPSVYRPDGQVFLRNTEWAAEAPPYSNALFLVDGGEDGMATFYPELGKRYTPSFETREGPDGKLYCAGFYGDDNNEQVDGYFIYCIDPDTRQGAVLKLAGLPRSLREVYLRKNAAADRKPVPGLALRWLDWTPDGHPWMLAEQQNFDIPPGRIETAVLLRLDSTYRITNTRDVEKYQRLIPGDAQNFAAMAACPTGQSGWWLLWNTGSWPQAKIMLTDCRSRGIPEEHTLDISSRSNVSLLPQTLLQRDGHWYFVGESEYHERIRIGMLQPESK